jgi:anthranilate synthase/aminodeoxychorismate synthase-like glutamine amidotransferase
MKPRVVILDNYDSYAHNLYQRIGEITSTEALVVRNDAITVAELRALVPTHVVVSPGPGRPDEPGWFGICADVIRELGAAIPVLGVCLGHQGIATAFGGRVARAPSPMHGKTSLVRHDGSVLYEGIDSPFTAMRYHSLVVDDASLPGCLRVTARTDDGVVMGLAHVERPIYGVQFHPESIGTPSGVRLLRSFMQSLPR